MDDFISRQDAIDAFEEQLDYLQMLNKDDNPTAESNWYGVNWARNTIADLPSAQQWIPCGERMPEEREWIGTKQFGTTISDEVYVTFECPDGARFAKHLCFQNGKLSNHDQQTIDVFYKGAIPIAWMPLPEPYEPQKRSE